jgi:callose synthase
LGYLQTWLLYHNALSRGVEIDHILQYARKTKEKAAIDTESVVELRNRLAEQEKKIQELLQARRMGGEDSIGERSTLNASQLQSGYGATPDLHTRG